MSGILTSVHKARDEAGATSPKGRRLTIVSQIVQTPPVDDDQARRQRGILQGVEQDLRGLVAAERGGAA